MQVIDLMRTRYSVRAFADRAVSRETLLTVLEAARFAPTACNNQPWRMLVVQESATRTALATCYPQAWLATAPVILVCCAEPAKAWCRRDGKNHADIDVTIAVDHLTLAATEAGLGSCWICAFDAVKVRQLLQMPASLDPVALLPLGYPAPEATPNSRHSQRKPMDELVQWERF
jgi:nitroreductase